MLPYCRLQISLLLLVIQVITGACGSNISLESQKDLPQPPATPPINICDSYKYLDSSDGQQVQVQGDITGYHELVLFGHSCISTRNTIELRFPVELRDYLFEQVRMSYPGRTDAKGTITVTGRLVRGGGTLSGYPARIIRMDAPYRKESPLIVDRIDVNRIDDYQPINSPER